MIQYVLFLTDFVAAATLSKWVLFSLVAYFFYVIMFERENKYVIYSTLFLILLQDCFRYGRFGLILFPLIPAVIAARLSCVMLHKYWHILSYFALIAFFLILDHFLIRKWLFCLNTTLESTILKIFGTIIVGTLILFGTRGNRFLRSF